MSRLFVLALAALAVPAASQTGGLAPFESDSAFAEYVHVQNIQRYAGERIRRELGCTGGRSSTVLTGRVVDAETGEMLIGANVYLPSIKRGAATDIDGKYSIPCVLKGERDVIYSYTGYQSRTVHEAEIRGDTLRVDVELEVGEFGEVVVMYQAPFGDTGQSVTNNQTAGVDEGGIVKLLGDHLVILRRGRLFTVALGDGALRPVDAADIPSTGGSGGAENPYGAWYDELLIVDRTAVVVGYNYQRDGTELVLFDVSEDGGLAYRSTYHLRSNDYYSSANYAGRVVSGRLVFYTPLRLSRWQAADLSQTLPGLRRWTGGADGPFEPVASVTSVYRPARDLIGSDLSLHAVTSCAVADGALDCNATVALGPAGHTLYVSGRAVYVWLSSGRPKVGSMLYRLPLDGSRPSALGVAGGPINQFSFLETDDALYATSSEWPEGQWMWNSERPRQALSLLCVPLDAFGDGSRDAPPEWYHTLPTLDAVDVNRFVGGHLLYGSSHADDDETRLLAVALAEPGRAFTLPTEHAVERVEVMGGHAVVVGSGGGDLHFSSVRLGERPRLAGRFRLADAAQGETRSHGFFYRPDAPADGAASGTLGLPVRHRGGRYASLREGSASVVYLRNRDLRLEGAGALDASGETPDDACRASCVDWYGNARPLFVGDRVFALLGYEVVEGRMRGGRVREVGRVSFAPLEPLTAR